jgi:hypothetical protein
MPCNFVSFPAFNLENFMRSFHIVLIALAFLAVLPARAATSLDGYLCCNMRSDGIWISDINYIEEGKTLIPAGTPVKVTGQGRQRIKIEILGRRQALGNDYSRDLGLDAFTHALREKRRLFRAEMDSAGAEGIFALDGCK